MPLTVILTWFTLPHDIWKHYFLLIGILLFRTQTIRARNLELVIPPSQRYQGVVCSMKESFGFIERADVVREIFFHYSEVRDNINDIHLGDDVEFSIQMRNVSLLYKITFNTTSVNVCLTLGR